MIRVATYNIRKCVGLDWRRRPDRILRVLAELDADVVALQEADRRFGDRSATLSPRALRAEAGMAPVALPLDGPGMGWRGNALLVREGVEVRAAAAVPLPSLEPRGAVLAELDVRGTPLRVMGVHLGLRQANRRRQAAAILAALAARADAMPEAVLGDFNEWRIEGGSIAFLRRRLRPAPPRMSFHASAPMAPLDRVLVGGGLRVAACGAHRSETARTASDHLPVWADVAPAAPDHPA